MACRVLVLQGYGFNCEEETAAGYRLAGAEPQVAFAADWLAGRVDLANFDLLHVPGGFSFGDDLGSGQVFATRLKYGRRGDGSPMWPQVTDFLARGGRIVGICNGFQILVRAGLLPNIGGQFAQECSLAVNLSGRFEDRWVRCRSAGRGTQRFGRALFELPVRHGEGRLLFGSDELRTQAEQLGLVALQYADQAGEPTLQFPANPNGAELCAAGLFSADGQVFGMMPHPEAFLSAYNHPDWPRRKRLANWNDAVDSDGLALLRSFVQG